MKATTHEGDTEPTHDHKTNHNKNTKTWLRAAHDHPKRRHEARNSQILRRQRRDVPSLRATCESSATAITWRWVNACTRGRGLPNGAFFRIHFRSWVT
jgi:hypothetical protein